MEQNQNLEIKRNKKMVIISIVVALTTLLSSLPIILLAEMLEIDNPWRIFLIIFALIIVVTGIIIACILDYNSGSFECRKCKKLFKPTISAYLWGPHTITNRLLKCPHCNKYSFCKKRLIVQTNEKIFNHNIF